MPAAPRPFDTAAFPESNREIVAVVSRILERRRDLLRAWAIAIAVITAIVFLIPSDYESVAHLMPPDKQQLDGLAAMMASAGEEKAGSAISNMVFDSLGLKSSGALYVGVLRSNTILDTLVDRFDLRKVYHCRYRNDARKRLSEQTEVTEDRKSGIIGITVTDRSPQRAQQMAAAYVEMLNQLTAQLNSSAAHRERLFIEDRLKTAKMDLEAADKDLSEFSSKNLTLDVKEQGKAMVAGAATLEGELIATESQLSGLEQIYTSNNVRVKALQARVDLLKQKLTQFRGDSQQAGADADSRSDIGISISRLPVLGVTYYDLYRRAKIQEVVFETLTKQYELSRIQEAKELPTIKVLDKPELPEHRSSPHRTRLIALGTLLSFVAIIGWVWAAYRWERIDPEDSRKAVILELRATLTAAAEPAWIRLRARLQHALGRVHPEREQE